MLKGLSMITLTREGLFCSAGGFYIDPKRRVDLALITHAHSDHARRGSKHYICVDLGKELLERRVGGGAKITGVAYRETLKLGSVQVSFHPAGHILGSAQVRIQQGNEVWVVSGDYKREEDPTCDPFEVLKCDTFITEATFGDPKYEWGVSTTEVAKDIFDWWQENASRGHNSVLFAYALGKTQRILAELRSHTKKEVFLFGEAAELTACYRSQGVKMVRSRRLESLSADEELSGALVVAPHALANSENWMKRLHFPKTAFASGWMQTGAWGMRSRYDAGFIVSDHCDYPALVRTVQETGARRVLVLHGTDRSPFVRQLRKLGIQASVMREGEISFQEQFTFKLA